MRGLGATRHCAVDLLAELAAVEPYDGKERLDIAATMAFLRVGINVFDRKNFAGHLTSSGFLLSPDLQSVLLTHHAVLGMWMQFGGHADGDLGMRKAAMRETREESGIEDIELLSAAIFDVDVHEIPENPCKGEPRHRHYDIRYLIRAGHLEFVVSHESKALEWVPLRNVMDMAVYDGVRRMAAKAAVVVGHGSVE